MNRMALVAVLVLGVTMLAVACGGDGDDDTPTPTVTSPGITATSTPTATIEPTSTPTAPPPQASTVEVDLAEWSVTADVATVSAGSVTFATSNMGALAHELVVIRTDLAPDALVVEGSGVDEAASGNTAGKIEQTELPGGGSASATFDLTPGSYVLICNIAGHYQLGMRTGLTVQ